MKNQIVLKIIVFSLFTFSFQLLTFNSHAQGIAINTSGAAPNNSAMLDVSGTSQGVLINRMTTAQRTSISSPALGLLIFNTDCENFNYYTNSGWLPLSPGITGFPLAAGSITGTTSICPNQNGVEYSVSAISGATSYVWSYSGTGFTCVSGCNTNSITADFSDTFTSGNLTVYGTNACGNGTASTGTAITRNPPSVGGTAASNQTICGGSQPANITLSGNTGTIQWQSSPDNSTYTDISGATASPLTGAQMGTITATTYYRAVVTNGVCASAYSNVVTVITAVNDIDGNTYNTVSIGTQCWMKENLKTTHYSNGTSIQIVTDNTTWKNLATGARCYYNNDSMAYKATYGGLYNWYAVMNGEASSNANPSGVQGICPTGWHVPSDTEWGIMEVYLDNTVVASTADVWKGTDIGNKLKISGSCITCPNSPDGCWCSNSNANNSSNFTAFGSGCRYNHDGSFSNLGYQSSYWTSTASSTTMAWQHDLIYYLPQVQKSYYYKQRGYSLRCVKN